MRLAAVLIVVGCGPMGSPGNALLNAAIGVGVAAHERSQGRCYAACPHGTACNHATGYCDPLPCGGECRAAEECRPTPSGDRCLPPLEVDVLSSARPDAGADAAP